MQQGALRKFYANAQKNAQKYEYESVFSSSWQTKSYKRWVEFAFTWDETTEGYDFWKRIHENWYKYCEATGLHQTK